MARSGGTGRIFRADGNYPRGIKLKTTIFAYGRPKWPCFLLSVGKCSGTTHIYSAIYIINSPIDIPYRVSRGGAIKGWSKSVKTVDKKITNVILYLDDF
jgi:hypothetical protein